VWLDLRDQQVLPERQDLQLVVVLFYLEVGPLQILGLEQQEIGTVEIKVGQLLEDLAHQFYTDQNLEGLGQQNSSAYFPYLRDTWLMLNQYLPLA
jgi:hypothetical protein